MRNNIIILLILLSFSINLLSQEQQTNFTKPRASYGFYGDFNLNLHTADFRKLPGVPNCCPRFESGFGTGFSFGLLYDLPMSKSWMLGVRAGYSSIGAELSKIEPVTVIKNGQPQGGEFEHTLNASLSNIGIEPLIGWRLFDNFTLHAGFRIGFTLTKDYEQLETIVKPEAGATFLDSLGNDTHSRTRNDFSGELEDASSINLSVLAGISYELPLNADRTLILAPEVFFYYGITPVVKDLTWNASSIRAGVAIKYSPLPKPEIIEERKGIEKIDTITIELPSIAKTTFKTGKPRIEYKTTFVANKKIITENYFRTDTLLLPYKYLLKASIDVVGIDSAGREIPDPEFLIEEFISTRLRPLLNYIFFEENSYDIPSRYRRLSSKEASGFHYEKLYNVEIIPTYYQVLNVIGRRMKENPNARLRIVGCNSNSDNEKGNLQLSRRRAESVKNYLITVWEITDSRLKIEVRNLPKKASTPIDEPDKTAENRRVELYSNAYEILEPVLTKDTICTINPAIARFKPNAESEAGLNRWALQVYRDAPKGSFDSVQNLFESSAAGDIPVYIDWNIAEARMIIPRTQKSLDYSLYVKDKFDQGIETQTQNLKIKLRSIEEKRSERIADKEIDRYSLILFDFDQSDIKGTNRKIVNLIRGRIKPNSKVKITGYTDRTGEAEYNRELSLRRARTTANSLRQTNAEVRGLGKDILLYDNDLPEGRFYCRTVDITVETPISR